MIWGKTKEEKDAIIAAWKKWHEVYLYIPRKLEDTGEWAWLTYAWCRWEWNGGYMDASWVGHWVKELPPMSPQNVTQGKKLKATCIVCQEEEWPMCKGCRKAILAFKAVCE